MSNPGDTDLHFWLTHSVGRCMGLNFIMAIDEGRLSLEGYRDIVRACRCCAHVRCCQNWLGCQPGTCSQTRAPEFCVNARTLDALRPH